MIARLWYIMGILRQELGRRLVNQRTGHYLQNDGVLRFSLIMVKFAKNLDQSKECNVNTDLIMWTKL